MTGMKEHLACTFLFTLEATRLHEPLDSGEGPTGRRILNRALEGSFAGPRLRGTIVPGTGDWMLVRPDGVRVIDARLVLRTDDDAIIHMSYSGRAVIPAAVLPQIRDPATRHLVDPDRYYFRTQPTFETGAPSYAWLNDIVCVGYGRFYEGGGLGYDVYKVL